MGLWQRVKEWYREAWQGRTQGLTAERAAQALATVTAEHPDYSAFNASWEAAERLKVPFPDFLVVASLPTTLPPVPEPTRPYEERKRPGILGRLHERRRQRADKARLEETVREGGIVSQETVAEKAMGRRPESTGYEPLERIVRDSVALYNQAVERHRQGVPRALHTRYLVGATELGVEVGVYKDALREHVASSATHYDAWMANGHWTRIDRYAKPAREKLERFDRSLLPDYKAFAAEVAALYVEERELRVRDIAAIMTEKYGMRISSSHVSSVARGSLMDSLGYVSNRREAQKKHRARVRGPEAPS